MGGAIIRALASREDPANITAVDLNVVVLEQIAALGVRTTDDATAAIGDADVIILAVKPWFIENLLSQIGHHVTPHQVVASIAAGIDFVRMMAKLPAATPLARVIPNTAVTVGQSMTFVTTRDCNETQRRSVVAIFEAMGPVMEIPESQIAACTSLASCGIAFAMRYIRAASEAGVEMGVPPLMAQHIVSQTVLGAAALLMQTGNHPEAEIDKVTTPGGITIRGLNAMEEHGFTNAVIKGHKACI